MKEDEDKNRDSRMPFKGMEGHFHVLERRVPVEAQMRYFKYSEGLRKANRPPRPISEEECENLYDELMTSETNDLVNKRFLLSQLATSKSVRGFRLLEEYCKAPDPEVDDWANMALMEARIALESSLSEEKQIYISTGLGGKGQKLRFYLLALSKDNQVFLDYQRKVVEHEFQYTLPMYDCEIEQLTISDRYVELLFLMPVRADLKMVIDQVITECNQYGDFLSKVYTITNVKELTKEEIAKIIEKNGDNKTSD